MVNQIKSEYQEFKHVVCLSADASSVPEDERFLPELIRQGSPQTVASEVCEDDLYFILFTGGTTGVPKGVVHNHRTMVNSLAMELLDFGIGRNEVFLAATPLTHGAGALVPPVMLRGGSVVILTGFDPTQFLQTIQEERVTTAMVVPTMIYALLDHPDREKYDTSSLRNLLYGAAPIAPERLREAVQAFGPVFTQIYGQTEAPMALAVLSREEHILEGEDHLVARLASCGRPTLATRIKLIDGDGREVPPGEPGEIVALAPNIMVEYLNRPDLTAETVKDGWLHTGDVARQDEYGYLYIVDRAKDMIVSGGFNVFPKGDRRHPSRAPGRGCGRGRRHSGREMGRSSQGGHRPQARHDRIGEGTDSTLQAEEGQRHGPEIDRFHGQYSADPAGKGEQEGPARDLLEGQGAASGLNDRHE